MNDDYANEGFQVADFNKEFIYSDCSISSITYCPYGCSSGNCKSTPSGCTYNNPACSSGYTCQNNQCIKQQLCNQECSNHNQRRCVGNQVYLCHNDNNGCWIENSIDSCPTSNFWYCVNGQCVQQIPKGCEYGNPACPISQKCINNVCMDHCKEETICEDRTLYHQYSNCQRLTLSMPCTSDCLNGECPSLKGCNYKFPVCDFDSTCINNECVKKQVTQTEDNIQKLSPNPIILIRGHSFDSRQESQDEKSLDKMQELLLQLNKDLDKYWGGAPVIPSDASSNQDYISWCNDNIKYMRQNNKNSMIIPFDYYYGGLATFKDQERSISKYSDTLNKALNVIYGCTNSQMTIIAHSMGGLVARKYLQKYGDSKVNKLIMLGTPNNGIPKSLISGFVEYGCQSNHPGPECDEMIESSNLMTELNKPKTDSVTYITIAGNVNSGKCNLLGITPYMMLGKAGDCVVPLSSVQLTYAAHNYVVSCQHNDLYIPTNCPEAYQYIKKVLTDDSSINNQNSNLITNTQTSVINRQSQELPQQQPITKPQSVIKNQPIQTKEDITSQNNKPEIQKPKETQPEPQKQEQKREDAKTIASSIKSWFSKWFG